MPSTVIKILAITGSTRKNSSNFKILKYISNHLNAVFEIEIFEDLATLPHFNPDLDTETPPEEIISFRNKILNADGILICTPEYVFSLPGSLKNALEWCVSASTFSGKPAAIITASALGEKAHESLQLIMKTIEAKMTDDTQLLISGVRSKVNSEGEIIDKNTLDQIKRL